MPSFNSQSQKNHGIYWPGIIRTLIVQVLVLFAVSVAVSVTQIGHRMPPKQNLLARSSHRRPSQRIRHNRQPPSKQSKAERLVLGALDWEPSKTKTWSSYFPFAFNPISAGRDNP